MALAWPDTRVALYYPGDRALPQHHSRVWASVSGILSERGVSLHPGHRAVVPPGFDLDRITTDPVTFSTGQPDAPAGATLWAVGRVQPNTAPFPDCSAQRDGSSGSRQTCRSSAHPGCSPSATWRPRTHCADRRATRPTGCSPQHPPSPGRRPLRTYRARRRRWGSVLGFQPDGLRVFTPSGRSFRFPAWSIQTVLQPWIVRRGIYGGVRRNRGHV